ncbi:MAG TPA: hypothetical protein VHE57_06065 [Mycobacteriales bacterium]|nr:hypothetical protein [Mycobacteriales bacterium]
MGQEAEEDLLARGIIGELPPGSELPRTGRLSIPVPSGLQLDRVVRSHGWCGLAPGAYDEPRRIFHRTLALPDAGPLTVRITQPDGPGTALVVSWGRVAGTRADRAAVRAQVAHMLALDTDLTALHRVAPKWVRDVDGGRLLRSPTVWEDLARMLATTNCSWRLTQLMVARLVATLGAEGPAGERAFPTPAAVVAAGEAHLRDVVRAGYRSRSFIELARFCTGVEERWLYGPADGEPDHAVVEEEIRALRGFGPYAAEGMLGLLGRPRGFAVDSWVRAKLGRSEPELREEYARFGEWAGTMLWLDLTRSWFRKR